MLKYCNSVRWPVSVDFTFIFKLPGNPECKTSFRVRLMKAAAGCKGCQIQTSQIQDPNDGCSCIKSKQWKEDKSR